MAETQAERGTALYRKVAWLCEKETSRDKAILDSLYKILDIIDSKASTLLRVNGMFLSIIGAVLGFSAADASDTPLTVAYRFVGVTAFVLFAYSAHVCLQIVKVKWDFMKDVTSPATGVVGNASAEQEGVATIVVVRTDKLSEARFVSYTAFIFAGIGWIGLTIVGMFS